MIIEAIKAFSDNYIWALTVNGGVIIVDPGESSPVFDYLEEKDHDLMAILLTHKHADHVDGVEAIKEKYPEVVVYGPEETRALNDQTVRPEEKVDILGLNFEVIFTPGHTEGHISYLVGDELFCGDALFMAGCGRVFTGDYEAAYQTLQTFKALPDRVRVYAGHEYSATNLRFAQSINFNEEIVGKALEKVTQLTDLGAPSLPSTIGQEKEINPFIQAPSLETFVQRRIQRDQF